MRLAPRGTVGIILAAVLALLSALHIWWAFAGLPAGIQVVPAIPGAPALVPSPAACMAVAAVLIVAALVVLSTAELMLTSVPWRIRRLACAALGCVFVLRAIGELRLIGFFKSIRETEFALWDTWVYSPLCLALGLGALWLARRPPVARS